MLSVLPLPAHAASMQIGTDNRQALKMSNTIKGRPAPAIDQSPVSTQVPAPRLVHVRRATPDDANRLLPLCAAHAAYERAPVPSASSEHLRWALQGAQPRLLAWVVEVKDEILGYLSGSVAYCTWTSTPYFLMDCLFVMEAYRSLGLGKALMQEMCTHAIEIGCQRVEWLTPTWNELAIRFYEAGGATPQDRVRFRLPLST